ncbi:MAG TPA: Lpg1974 family pore-forming outer membrane protein [Rhabdochlamydiaceae bacterium]|jgi:hypothetical protein
MKKCLLLSLAAISPFLLLHAEKVSSIFLEEWAEEIDGKKRDEDTDKEELLADSDENEEASTLVYTQNASSSSSRRIASESETYSNFTLPINHKGEFVDLEFLWWKLDENALEYAIQKKSDQRLYNTPPPPGADALVGHWHRAKLEWSPGFRVKAGLRFDKPSLWELDAVYTYYYTDGDNSVFRNSDQDRFNSENIAFFYGINVGGVYIRGSSKAQFWYHVGDIELASQFHLTPHAHLRLVIGPTLVFIKQKYRITSFGNVFRADPQQPTQKIVADFNWNFSGGGIKIGGDSRWDIGKGFDLLFGAAVSSVYGVFENEMKENIFYTGAPFLGVPFIPAGKSGDTHFSRGKVAFATRLEGGTSWSHAFCAWNLEMFVKYELNTWFNITDQYRESNGNPNSPVILSVQIPSLNLQGITVGVNVNF